MTEPSKPLVTTILRSSWFGLAVVGLLSFFVNLLVLVSPIYMQQVYDRVLTTHHSETLIYLSIFAAICLLFLGLFDTARSYALTRIGRWWDETLHDEVLAAALYQSRLSGQAATAALSDLQTVRGFVGSPNLFPFFDAPWMPLFLLLLAVIHPWLGIIGLGGAAILFGLAVLNDVGTRKAVVLIGEQSNYLQGFVATTMRHADAIHAMGMFRAVADRYSRTAKDISDATQLAGDRASVIGGSTKSIRIAIQMAILGVGAYLAIGNEITPGGMIAASIILGRALAPVEQGLGTWKGFISARAAHRRLIELVTSMKTTEAPMSLPAPVGNLSVENVSLMLPGRDRPVLRAVDFRIEAGTVLALVGPSASGKSTLCRVMVGSWSPTAGHVRLDGADLSQWDRAELGRYVGYMPQTVELFGGSVRDNIARLGDATDEEVIAAATVSGCHELILRLPKGYATDIGEAGSHLSGGQKQRIALARALLRTPRLIVLDEPNSNLDTEGETKLAGAIQAMKKAGSTVLIVSHRMPLFGVVDKIAVMRDGALEKFGPRDTILAELSAQNQRRPRPPLQAVQSGTT
jgi:ATP-binding cassette, subfamily C, bacterial exporter for protease/lipase